MSEIITLTKVGVFATQSLWTSGGVEDDRNLYLEADIGVGGMIENTIQNRPSHQIADLAAQYNQDPAQFGGIEGSRINVNCDPESGDYTLELCKVDMPASLFSAVATIEFGAQYDLLDESFKSKNESYSLGAHTIIGVPEGVSYTYEHSMESEGGRAVSDSFISQEIYVQRGVYNEDDNTSHGYKISASYFHDLQEIDDAYKDVKTDQAVYDRGGYEVAATFYKSAHNFGLDEVGLKASYGKAMGESYTSATAYALRFLDDAKTFYAKMDITKNNSNSILMNYTAATFSLVHKDSGLALGYSCIQDNADMGIKGGCQVNAGLPILKFE